MACILVALPLANRNFRRSDNVSDENPYNELCCGVSSLPNGPSMYQIRTILKLRTWGGLIKSLLENHEQINREVV